MFKRSGLSRRASSGRASAPRVEPLEGRALMTLDFGPAGALGGPSISPSRTAIDAAGNAYVMGTFKGQVVFDPGANREVRDSGATANMFVAKYAPSGGLLWVTTFDDDESGVSVGEGGGGGNFPQDIALDAAGNAYVVGSFSGRPLNIGSGAGAQQFVVVGDDAFLVKLDPGGRVAPGMARAFGGEGSDKALAVAIAPDGASIYVGGRYEGAVDFNRGGGAAGSLDTGSPSIARGFVAKFSANLGFVWAVEDPSTSEGVSGLAADKAGSVYAVAGDPASNSVITRFNGATKEVVASRVYAPGASFFGAPTRVVVDGDGNAYVGGTFVGAGVDFSPIGGTVGLDSAGGADAYLAKFDGNLGLVWARRFGSSTNDMAVALAIDASKNLYLGGGFGGPASFGQSVGGTPVLRTANDALSQSDGFVIRVDAAGNYLDGRNIGGAGDDMVFGLAVNPAGTVAVTGVYGPPIQFGATSLGTLGASNLFFGRLSGAAVVDPPVPPPVKPPVVPPVPPPVVPPVTVIYPSVTGVSAAKNKKKGIASFSVTFGADLTGLINPSAVSVTVLGKNKKRGYVQPLALAGVSYDPASRSMTVRLAKPRKGAMQLNVGAGAVVSTTGGPLPSSYRQVFKG